MTRRLAVTIVKRNPSTGVVEVFPAGTMPPGWAADLISPDSHVWAAEEAATSSGTERGGGSPEPPPRVGRGSSRAAWAAYAAEVGIEVSDDMGRDDIIEAVS